MEYVLETVFENNIGKNDEGKMKNLTQNNPHPIYRIVLSCFFYMSSNEKQNCSFDSNPEQRMVHYLADGIGDRRHFGHRANAARAGLLVGFPATRPKGTERSRHAELGLSAEARHLGRPPVSAGNPNNDRSRFACTKIC